MYQHKLRRIKSIALSREIRAIVLMSVLSAAVCADRYHPKAVGRSANCANPAENTAQYWYDEAFQAIRAKEARGAATEKRAKNIVMFIGDGMSVPTLAAARTLLEQLAQSPGEETQLSFEKFPTVGLSKTYCVNAQVADSACTSTAYLRGVKASYGTLGVTAEVDQRNCNASTDTSTHVKSIAEWALDSGRDVGIVTTTRITHASPAGTYAKSANREWENDFEVKNDGFDTDRCPDIAHQLVNMDPGRKFKVLLGGGRREFRTNQTLDEENTRGSRTDDRDLIQEWQNNKRDLNMTFAYVYNRSGLLNLEEPLPEYLLGLFEGDHMKIHKVANPETEPTITELTEMAIKSLNRNENGFFLFVEGGRIDHAHHLNVPNVALDETIEMHKAVQRATELLPEEDTLIVVSADHAHVMTFNGYSPRGRDILGTSNDLDDDGVPYMTLSYANGPGFRQHVDGIRYDVTKEDNYRHFNWSSHADVPLEYDTHGGDDVAVFARGPQHTMFTGLYEQSQIPHLMAYAACIGPGPNVCERSSATVNTVTLLAFVTLILLFCFRM